jgi:hypothetical protein
MGVHLMLMLVQAGNAAEVNSLADATARQQSSGELGLCQMSGGLRGLGFGPVTMLRSLRFFRIQGCS